MRGALAMIAVGVGLTVASAAWGQEEELGPRQDQDRDQGQERDRDRDQGQDQGRDQDQVQDSDQGLERDGLEEGEDPVLVRAKDLHRQGLVLLEAGDVERALDYFQRSRAVYPSAPNVTNEAICLERLGRYDEALEAYEVLLTQFADGLAEDDRAAVAPAMKRLRAQVASLWISANESVLAGEHVVRIQKPGFEPWETTITSTVQQTVNLDARLEPLANVGVLRVESPVEGRVVIDGAEVGSTPWEGPLSPGPHRMWLRAGEQGSAPQQLIVVEGQIVLARPKLAPLGPELRLEVEPPTATIVIDGLEMGSGSWAGRLVEGDHVVIVRERGYHERQTTVRAVPGEAPTNLSLRLDIDRDHPRWPRPAPEQVPGELWIDGFVGYAGSPTMGADAEQFCPTSCTGNPTVHGGITAARLGYRFPMQLSLEVGVGYLLFGTALKRVYNQTWQDVTEHLASYVLVDRPLVRGPFLAPGLSYRYAVADWLALDGRAALGIYFAAASADVDAEMGRADGPVVDAVVANRDLQRTVTVFVMPSIAATFTLGPIDLGIGLGVLWLPLEGPRLNNGPLQTTAAPDPVDDGALGNAPASDAIAGERVWGPTALAVPNVNVGYRF